MLFITHLEGFFVGYRSKWGAVNLQYGVSWPQASSFGDASVLHPRNVHPHTWNVIYHPCNWGKIMVYRVLDFSHFKFVFVTKDRSVTPREFSATYPSPYRPSRKYRTPACHLRGPSPWWRSWCTARAGWARTVSCTCSGAWSMGGCSLVTSTTSRSTWCWTGDCYRRAGAPAPVKWVSSCCCWASGWSWSWSRGTSLERRQNLTNWVISGTLAWVDCSFCVIRMQTIGSAK